VEYQDELCRVGLALYSHKWLAVPAQAFGTIICAECGEVTVECCARVKHGQIVSIPCAAKP